MTIKTALAVSDSLAKSKTLSSEQWAIRVLAGAYRREKQIGKTVPLSQARETVAQLGSDKANASHEIARLRAALESIATLPENRPELGWYETYDEARNIARATLNA